MKFIKLKDDVFKGGKDDKENDQQIFAYYKNFRVRREGKSIKMRVFTAVVLSLCFTASLSQEAEDSER